MQKVKITKVYRGEVETQYGKKQKIGIKTDSHGEKWLSCFVNKTNENMLSKVQEGDERDIIVTQSGDFLNFRLPTGFDYLRKDVDELQAAVFGTGKAAQAPAQAMPATSGQSPVGATGSYPYPGTEQPDGSTVPDPEDIPF